MAITQKTLPEQVSLARSPVEVKLKSNQPTSATPVNWLVWEVAGNPAVDETVTIAYGAVSETITVKTTADNTGKTISLQGALSLADYAGLIVTELKKNYSLFLNFLIEYNLDGSTHQVLFKPRGETGFTWSFTDGLTNITVSINAPVNAGYNDNPAVLLLVEIYDHEDAAYRTPLPHVLPVISSDTFVIFNIQSDFDLGPALPPAASIGSGGEFFNPCLKNWTKYRLYWAEQYGSPAQTNAIETNEVEYFTLFGGNDFFNQFENFWSFFKTNGNFLTVMPREQTVTYEQPIWLYFVGRFTTGRELKIVGTAYKRSGAEVEFERSMYTEALGEVLAVKAGYTQLQLPDDAADPIISYEISLEADGLKGSETFTFNITGECDEFTRYFLFANSVGGCDTVRATAKHVTRLEISTQSAARIVDEDTIADGDGADFDYNRRSRVVFEGSVGYKDASYIAYLQGLLNAPAAWLIDIDEDRFTPIQIDAGTIELLKDGEDLYTLKFGYRFAWEDAHAGIPDNRVRIPYRTGITGRR